MKIKHLIILFLILSLTGCVPTTPATDEAQVKTVIQEYFLAMGDQNWNKAKNYCVYESDRYYAVCQFENLVNTLYLYCKIITINTAVDILDVSIYGNYSQAFCSVSVLITYCGYYESDSTSGYYYLQKIGNQWKLY